MSASADQVRNTGVDVFDLSHKGIKIGGSDTDSCVQISMRTKASRRSISDGLDRRARDMVGQCKRGCTRPQGYKAGTASSRDSSDIKRTHTQSHLPHLDYMPAQNVSLFLFECCWPLGRHAV